MLTISELEDFIKSHIDGIKPSPADLKRYRLRIGAYDLSLDIKSSGSKQLFQKAVVFVTDRPNYFFLRVSIALKKRGIKTVLLTRWGVEPEQGQFFDHIVLYDTIFDLKALNECHECLIYVQCWVGWNFLPLYIKLITTNQVACNVNDLIGLLFDKKEHAVLLGLSEIEISMDILCERIILEDYELVTLPYTLEALENIDTELYMRFDKNIFYMPCYPVKPFFAKPNQRQKKCTLNLLYIGGVPPDHKSDKVFNDAKLHGIVSNLLNSPFNLTIYNNPQIAADSEKLKLLYPHFTEIEELNNSFHFRVGYPPWQLKKHARDFDYGLMLYIFDDVLISKNHYRTIIPTKFFTYMELGLPVIVIDEMEAVSKIVVENNLGVIIAKDEIKNLDQILIKMQNRYSEILESIAQYRIKNSMDNMVWPVLEAYSKIIR